MSELQSQQPPQTPQPPQSAKKSRARRRRIILLVLLILVVLGALAAVSFRDNARQLVRQISYSQSNDFPHNAQADSLFLGLGNNLLVCTQSQVQLFSPTGEAYVKDAVSMLAPAMNASGKYAVAYDVGGQQLRLIEGQELIHEKKLTGEDTFLCATVNERGWVAAITKEGGYKGVVTVYNPAFEEVLTIRISSRYVSDAVVTPDCRGVYIISPAQLSGNFENTLFYYTFSENEAPTRETSLGSNVVLGVRSAERCWIMGDKELMILDSSGVITGVYSYEEQFVKMGSLQGDGFATLFLSRSATGSGGTLVTVNQDGQLVGLLPLQGQALSISAQEQHVAALTTSEIVTTTLSTEHYTLEPNQKGVRRIAVFDDGTTALINSASVSLYFPDQVESQTNPNVVVAEPAQGEEAPAEEAPAEETWTEETWTEDPAAGEAGTEEVIE